MKGEPTERESTIQNSLVAAGANARCQDQDAASQRLLQYRHSFKRFFGKQKRVRPLRVQCAGMMGEGPENEGRMWRSVTTAETQYTGLFRYSGGRDVKKLEKRPPKGPNQATPPNFTINWLLLLFGPRRLSSPPLVTVQLACVQCDSKPRSTADAFLPPHPQSVANSTSKARRP